MPEPPQLTQLVKEMEEKIKKILKSDVNIVERVVFLRKMARDLAKEHVGVMNYDSLDDFQREYDKGKSSIVKLEGSGISYGNIVVLKKCPMAPLFKDFKVEGKFPDYRLSLPAEYMEKFREEAILHPLCIIHQTFRDLLVSKIPKEKGVIHSLAVACRSDTGRVIYSKLGLSIAKVSKEKVDTLIEGFACAFYVR